MSCFGSLSDSITARGVFFDDKCENVYIMRLYMFTVDKFSLSDAPPYITREITN